MKITHRSKVHGFILEAALLAGLGFVTHAAAQQEASYFIDLSSRTAINLGSLGGSRTIARALNDLRAGGGRVLYGWRGTPCFYHRP